MSLETSKQYFSGNRGAVDDEHDCNIHLKSNQLNPQLCRDNVLIPTFPNFSSLPSEIRNMIWDFSLLAPQIIIFRQDMTGRQNANKAKSNLRDDIMQACKESRERVSKLHLPYYELEVYHMGWRAVQRPKHYFDPNVDTFWVEDSALLPDNIEFYCGVCPNQTIFPQRSLIPSNCKHDIRIDRIVIPLSKWKYPIRFGNFFYAAGTTETLWKHNSARELYLVVGDTALRRDTNGDIQFIEPETAPQKHIDDEEMTEQLPLNQGPGSISQLWVLAAKLLEQRLKEFKDERAETRNMFIANGTSLAYLDAQEDSMDLSFWNIPKVRYVDLQSRNSVL